MLTVFYINLFKTDSEHCANQCGFYHYDSLNLHNTKTLGTSILNFLTHRYNDLIKPENPAVPRLEIATSVTVSQQPNGYDCGVYAIELGKTFF